MSAATGNPSSAISQRSATSKTLDTGFILLTRIFAAGVGILLLWIAIIVGIQAIPAIQTFGLGFITSSTWNPVKDIYGAWPHVYGTLVSASIALLLALPVGVGVALFLSEDFLPARIQNILVFVLELLAAIPSVVYGFWGIVVLIPTMRYVGGLLNRTLGWLPLFALPPGQTEVTGPGMHVAGVVLAIMILPIIAAISRDALISVAPELRQAALGLGATRWETILKIMLPAASSGIVGGTMLALGRALGETMAVTMVIGNAKAASTSVLLPASTIASLLANEFAEADGLQLSSLMYTALILFGLTLLVNVLAEVIVRRFRQI